MDDLRFDAIARGLARDVGRRALLRALAGGLLGMAAGLVGRGTAAKPNPGPAALRAAIAAKTTSAAPASAGTIFVAAMGYARTA